MTHLSKRFGDVCDFKVVKNTKSLPYVGMEDVESNTGKFLGSRDARSVKSTTAYFDESCVLYGKLRPYLNKVLVPDFEGHSSTEFVPLRPDLSQLSREWLAMWLRSPFVVSAMSAKTTGSRMPRADLKHLKNLEIPLPPLAEQKKIVAKLEAVLGKIKEAKRLRAEAESVAASLLSAELHKIFEEGKKKGWERTTLGAEIDLLTGFPFKSAEYVNGSDGILLLRGDNIIPGGLRWADAKKFPNTRIKDYSKYMLESGDLVLAMDRPWINAGLKYATISSADLPALLVQRVARIRPKAGIISGFLGYVVFSDEFSRHVLGSQTGSSVPHISAKQIESFSFNKPPLAEQKKIVAHLDALAAKIAQVREYQKATGADLAALEKSVLAKAFAPQAEQSTLTKSPIKAVKKDAQPMPSPFYRNQVLAAIIEQVVKDSGDTTEVAVAKYNHLLQEVMGLSLGYEFQTHQFGPFDGKIKQLMYSGLGKNRWFTKNKGNIVPGSNMGALVARESNLYKDARAAMLELSQKGITKFDAKSLELLSTICHAIKATQSTQLSRIVEFMSTWNTNDGMTKVQKFSPTRIEKCLAFILRENLQQRLLN